MKTIAIIIMAVTLFCGCGAHVSGQSGPNAGGRAEVPVIKW